MGMGATYLFPTRSIHISRQLLCLLHSSDSDLGKLNFSTKRWSSNIWLFALKPPANSGLYQLGSVESICIVWFLLHDGLEFWKFKWQFGAGSGRGIWKTFAWKFKNEFVSIFNGSFFAQEYWRYLLLIFSSLLYVCFCGYLASQTGWSLRSSFRNVIHVVNMVPAKIWTKVEEKRKRTKWKWY